MGLRVIADLHGGDPSEKRAIEEYKSIKENVFQGVRPRDTRRYLITQRATDVKTYAQMWSKYRYRVLIAMSSQLFAQLVRTTAPLCADHAERHQRRVTCARS